MKLLIVDDNDAIRELIRSIVATKTDEIRESSDGAAALREYADFRPDFVLMDIEMKTVDGIHATENIRSLDPDARVVIVTNHDQQPLRQAALDAGACAYLVKDDLLELKRFLDSYR